MNRIEDDDPKFSPRPIILITGATGAVGYGICLRLMYQLSQPIQTDLSSKVYDQVESEGAGRIDRSAIAEEDHQSIYATPNGLTLLIACRSESKYRSTKLELENELKKLISSEKSIEYDDLKYSYIDRLTGQVECLDFDEYRTIWLENLRIDWLPMDLYQARTVIESIKLINSRYGYLTHLLLNAGGGPFVGIDWIGLLRAMIRNFNDALTYPDYLIEDSKITETTDGLPETWQLNVFSHYLLARESLPLLSKGAKKLAHETRIVWTSSLDARSSYFDRKDLECYRPGCHAYQSTKYQSEIVGQGFQEIILQHGLNRQVTSLVAHPGVVAGNMFLPIIGSFLDRMMKWTFSFARSILGSPHHVGQAYLAGLVWTKLCLSQAVDLDIRSTSNAEDGKDPAEQKPSSIKRARPFIRFGARCNRWGNPFIAKESLEGDDLEVNDRITDQRLVIDHCDQRANALLRLWGSSTSL